MPCKATNLVLIWRRQQSTPLICIPILLGIISPSELSFHWKSGSANRIFFSLLVHLSQASYTAMASAHIVSFDCIGPFVFLCEYFFCLRCSVRHMLCADSRVKLHGYRFCRLKFVFILGCVFFFHPPPPHLFHSSLF